MKNTLKKYGSKNVKIKSKTIYCSSAVAAKASALEN